jgi:hypothetical protein
MLIMRKYFRGRESAAEVNSAMKSILIKILGAISYHH